MKKKLEHKHAIAREMALEATDVLEALNPNVPGDKLWWKLLPLQEFGMDPDHEEPYYWRGKCSDSQRIGASCAVGK